MNHNGMNSLLIPNRRQFLKTGAAFALASSGALAMGGSTFAAPVKGGKLRVGTTGSSSDSLDPNMAVASNASWYRINQLYGTLLNYSTSLEGPVSKTKLSLAEEVESKSASQWVVRLKKGLTFHDGRPITADDLVSSVKRALQPDNQLLQLYKHIDGDNLRNAFLNAPWVKAVIPIRSGRESAALTWLRALEDSKDDGWDADFVPSSEDDQRLVAAVLADGNPPHLGFVLEKLAAELAKKNGSIEATIASDRVFESGFDPLAKSFDAGLADNDIFSQWISILPTDQIVASTYAPTDLLKP